MAAEGDLSPEELVQQLRRRAARVDAIDTATGVSMADQDDLDNIRVAALHLAGRIDALFEELHEGKLRD